MRDERQQEGGDAGLRERGVCSESMQRARAAVLLQVKQVVEDVLLLVLVQQRREVDEPSSEVNVRDERGKKKRERERERERERQTDRDRDRERERERERDV